MFKKLKTFILKIRCRHLYKQLPLACKLQLWSEFNKREDECYNEILKREFQYKGVSNAKN